MIQAQIPEHIWIRYLDPSDYNIEKPPWTGRLEIL